MAGWPAGWPRTENNATQPAGAGAWLSLAISFKKIRLNIRKKTKPQNSELGSLINKETNW